MEGGCGRKRWLGQVVLGGGEAQLVALWIVYRRPLTMARGDSGFFALHLADNDIRSPRSKIERKHRRRTSLYFRRRLSLWQARVALGFLTGRQASPWPKVRRSARRDPTG